MHLPEERSFSNRSCGIADIDSKIGSWSTLFIWRSLTSLGHASASNLYVRDGTVSWVQGYNRMASGQRNWLLQWLARQFHRLKSQRKPLRVHAGEAPPLYIICLPWGTCWKRQRTYAGFGLKWKHFYIPSEISSWLSCRLQKYRRVLGYLAKHKKEKKKQKLYDFNILGLHFPLNCHMQSHHADSCSSIR